MVEFTQLPQAIISGFTTAVAEVVDALTPQTPVVIQNSDTQYVASAVQAPARKPRPKTDLDGAERIQNAFAGVPQIPGQIDFAYDPIARIHGHHVMALRLKGQTVVTTIQNWPTEGKFAEALQDATMAANGYSMMSLSEKDLGSMVVRALPALTAVGAGTALVIEFPQANIQLSLETAIEIAKKSQRAGLAKFFVDSFIEFTALAPVPGAVTAEPQAKMLARLPLPLRHEVIRDMNSIGRYAGSRSGFVGLSDVQKMGPGFEQKAEPVQRSVPVRQAGWGPLAVFGLWLLSFIPQRFRSQAPAQLPPREPGMPRYDRVPEATEVLSLDGAAASPALMLVDVARFHRPDAANVRLGGATQPIMFEVLRTTGGNSVDGQQIRFDNQTVSSRHARVNYDPIEHVLTVADLGSTNGTQVLIGRQPPVILRTTNQRFDARGESMAVIKCGDATTTIYLKNGQGPVVVPSRVAPPRQGPSADALPLPSVAAKPAPKIDFRETVAAILRQFPNGIRGEHHPQRNGDFSADFRDAADNVVRVLGPGTLPPQILSSVAKRLGVHLGNTQARLPVSVIVHLVDTTEFNTQKEFRGINGQTLYKVETGGIVTVGQSGGNTMTSMSFAANEWGVATMLHPDTVTGRMMPSGIAVTVYMLVPESVAAAEIQVSRVATAIQNTLRPQFKPSHPLLTEFLDTLR